MLKDYFCQLAGGTYKMILRFVDTHTEEMTETDLDEKNYDFILP